MSKQVQMKSVQNTAKFAGVLYLVITVVAIIAHFYVPSRIIVPDDAAATINNIMASESLFRVGGIGGELVVLLSEVVLSILLYVLLKPVSKTLSLLASVSRLVMTTIHGINLINYFFVLLLVGGNYQTAFDPVQLQAMVTLFLDAHSYGFTIGIAFLTLHVFALAYLIFKSGYFPRILFILFMIAGAGYLIDSLGHLLTTGYQTGRVFIAIPIAIAEITFPLWLLIKGVNPQQWQKRSPETAFGIEGAEA
jgi:cbb3-type cytochrome oxidase subunit 3